MVKSDNALIWIVFIMGGLVLAVTIMLIGACYKKYLENIETIKWKRFVMEAKLKQIEESEKRSRRNTEKVINP